MDSETLVGKTLKEASELASEYNMIIRVRHENGEALMGTMDYRLDRINVSVEKGIITAVGNIG